jgi:hypothetical protein
MGKDYQTVMQSLLLKDHLKKHQLITITATARGEGKTEAANQVLWALIAKGHSACLVDYDIAKEARVSLDSELNFLSVNIQKLTSGDVITTRNDRQELAKNTTLLDSKLEELRVVFDFVVINSAPIDTHIEPVEMMKKSGITFFVFKANVSQIESVKNINLLTDEYKLQNLHLFLTGVNQSVNYSGNYVNQEVKIGNVIKKWISKLGLNLDILKI